MGERLTAEDGRGRRAFVSAGLFWRGDVRKTSGSGGVDVVHRGEMAPLVEWTGMAL